MDNIERILKLIEDSMNKKCNGLECKVVKNNIELRLENSHLKKQIDLIIEYFLNELHKYTSFGGVAEFCKNKKTVECYKTKCSICIKEYFSKLAKEKGE